MSFKSSVSLPQRQPRFVNSQVIQTLINTQSTASITTGNLHQIHHPETDLITMVIVLYPILLRGA